MDFKTAAVPYFYYVADQTPIVPQHVWASIARTRSPTRTRTRSAPGPFTMNPCSPAA